MKVDYISDLHLDFWIKELNRSLKLNDLIKRFCSSLQIGQNDSDVLVIAGDLGHYYVQDTAFLKHVKTMYKDVILTFGNHDLYLVSNSIRHKYKSNSFNRLSEMKQFCKNEGIHYLHGNVINIDGVTFGGTGMTWDKSYLEKLWGRDVPRHEVVELFNNSMNDCVMIMNVKDDNFDNELTKLQSIDHVDVVVTHYGPIVSPNTPLNYMIDPITTFFYFDGMRELERINPSFWIYGHTHTKSIHTAESTNLLCNPLGYPNENQNNRIESFRI